MASVRYRGRKIQHVNVQRRLHQWESAEQNAANYGYFKKVNFMTAQHRMWEQSDPERYGVIMNNLSVFDYLKSKSRNCKVYCP